MILSSLGGSPVSGNARVGNVDVFAALDQFAATALTPRQCDAALRRLKDVVQRPSAPAQER